MLPTSVHSSTSLKELCSHDLTSSSTVHSLSFCKALLSPSHCSHLLTSSSTVHTFSLPLELFTFSLALFLPLYDLAQPHSNTVHAILRTGMLETCALRQSRPVCLYIPRSNESFAAILILVTQICFCTYSLLQCTSMKAVPVMRVANVSGSYTALTGRSSWRSSSGRRGCCSGLWCSHLY